MKLKDLKIALLALLGLATFPTFNLLAADSPQEVNEALAASTAKSRFKLRIRLPKDLLVDGDTIEADVDISETPTISRHTKIRFKRTDGILFISEDNFLFPTTPISDDYVPKIYKSWIQKYSINGKESTQEVSEKVRELLPSNEIVVLVSKNGKTTKLSLSAVLVDIESPKNKSKYSYNNSRLSVPCKPSLVPEVSGPPSSLKKRLDSSDLRWAISSIEDSHGDGPQHQVQFSWTKGFAAANSKDGKVLFEEPNQATYEGLPASNSSFGEKKVDLTAERNLSVANGQIIWYAFFKPSERIHRLKLGNDQQETAVPNWFYYWAQEDSDKVCDFSRTSSDFRPVESVSNTNFPNALGLYNPATDTIEISDRFISRSLPEVFKVGPIGPENRLYSWKVESRTDILDVVISHERTHRKLSRASTTYGGDLPDVDGDGVPDEWEALLGLNTSTTDTYGTGFPNSYGGSVRDQEFYAWVNACFSGEGFSGSVLKNSGTPQSENITEAIKAIYKDRGIIPKKSRSERDWSEGGFNWKKLP